MERIALLLQKLAVTLSQLNWQLVTAESCTGGLIASTITEIPGSSTWFERGFVTYSPLAKQELLDVPNELINTYGRGRGCACSRGRSRSTTSMGAPGAWEPSGSGPAHPQVVTQQLFYFEAPRARPPVLAWRGAAGRGRAGQGMA